ncbi:unnamed protein product [Trichobilharzia szidati]|nr:unnamed protein product [Trichobilharzia szidati]
MEQPPIRILRRPCPHPSEIQKTPQRPTVVTKTLEQREADYAAARKRIMGSATPDPAEGETKDSAESDTTKITEDINNLTLKKDSCIPTTSATTQSTEVSAQKSLSTEVSVNRLQANQNGAQIASPQNYKQPLEVGANRKHQQHAQSTSNGVRQNLVTHQQRSATVSANRLSYFPQPSPLFSFQTGYNNVGLLPTPPGFQCSLQNGTNAGLQQTTAIALMHQFNLLQQQYQQTLTGFQKQLVSSGAHSSTNFNPLNFTSSLPQSHINHKYTHPPTFN